VSERAILAATLEATQSLAGRLARASKAGPPSILVGLIGELGAGKTAFVQAFVGALAPGEEHFVTSPTFAIVQEYRTLPPVTHMDLYRLSSLDELEAIGYRDLYFAPGVTLVEWIDRIPGAIPQDWLEIRLAVLPSDMREIRVVAHGLELELLVGQALA
jgi:tRNA threonylcarbamoyladenosine biosynthesis protein TsaE